MSEGKYDRDSYNAVLSRIETQYENICGHLKAIQEETKMQDGRLGTVENLLKESVRDRKQLNENMDILNSEREDRKKKIYMIMGASVVVTVLLNILIHVGQFAFNIFGKIATWTHITH